MQKRKSQKEFYDFIWDKKNWRPPTFSTMRKFLGVVSNQTILERIERLREKGKRVPFNKNL